MISLKRLKNVCFSGEITENERVVENITKSRQTKNIEWVKGRGKTRGYRAKSEEKSTKENKWLNSSRVFSPLFLHWTFHSKIDLMFWLSRVQKLKTHENIKASVSTDFSKALFNRTSKDLLHKPNLTKWKTNRIICFCSQAGEPKICMRKFQSVMGKSISYAEMTTKCVQKEGSTRNSILLGF